MAKDLAAVITRCDFCGRQGHSEQTCFMNPDNPNNKLTPKMKERMMLASNVSGLDDGDKPSKGKSKSGSNRKVELAGGIINRTTDRTTILPPLDNHTYHDIGATSHVFHSAISFIPGWLRQCTERTVLLADKSTVTSSQIGDML